MNKTTKAIEDYLECIFVLELENHNEKQVKSIDISKTLKVSKPAVAKAMNELIKLGYVEKLPYKEISLTKTGQDIAKDVYHRHQVIHAFLEQTLSLPHEIAERDCCLIEHVISKETLEAIEKHIK